MLVAREETLFNQNTSNDSCVDIHKRGLYINVVTEEKKCLNTVLRMEET